LRVHGECEHLKYLMCKRKRITRGSGAIESSIRRVINLRMKGKHGGALNALTTYLDDTAVAAEAELAAVDLAWDLRKNAKFQDHVATISKRLVNSSKNEDVVNKAERNLEAIGGGK
jgi:hypothetical protein